MTVFTEYSCISVMTHLTSRCHSQEDALLFFSLEVSSSFAFFFPVAQNKNLHPTVKNLI